MIDLYTSDTPNGRKISIALEELGLDWTLKEVRLSKGEQHSPEFVAISPNHKIPAIHDHDTGQTLFESGAILLYLTEKTGKLGGDRWDMLQWLMWQMGGVGPMLGQTHHFLHYNPGKAPYAETRYHGEARRLYGVLDARLSGRAFMAGDYSIADIATWPWIARFQRQQIDMHEFPNVLDWYRRIAARPAVQRGYDVPKMGETIPMP